MARRDKKRFSVDLECCKPLALAGAAAYRTIWGLGNSGVYPLLVLSIWRVINKITTTSGIRDNRWAAMLDTHRT